MSCCQKLKTIERIFILIPQYSVGKKYLLHHRVHDNLHAVNNTDKNKYNKKLGDILLILIAHA